VGHHRHLGKVSTRIWRAADLGAAELLRGRFSDYSYDVHSHDKACFALITSGAIRIRTRGTEMIARSGDLYAIDADEPHAGWPIDDGGWSLRTLYVDIAQLHALATDDDRLAAVPALAGPIIRDPELTRLFNRVHRGSEIAGPSLERQQMYLAFIMRLFERHARGAPPLSTVGREDRAIRLARDFLDHHLDEHVSLSDVAAAAGLPPFRLHRAFERAIGMSPHRYQRQARIRVAAERIRTGNPLSEAAVAAGFADQAHMTRTVRASLGVTPGAYRNAYLRA
jgi:AraC-like DNA-binding protein